LTILKYEGKPQISLQQGYEHKSEALTLNKSTWWECIQWRNIYRQIHKSCQL